MRRFLLHSVLALTLVAGGLAAVAPLAAQEFPKEGLPRAEDLLDREAKAAGDKEARRQVKTIATTMTISAEDMKVRMVVYHAGPNKHFKEISNEGLRKTEVVVNGNTAWVNDSITGARLLRGEEKAQAIRDIEAFIKDIHRGSWREEYKQVRTVAEENVAGRPAYKVEMTTTKGETVIAHYDKHSGLMVRQEKVNETPQGKARVIEFHTDHRKVGGLVMPFAGRVVQGPNEFLVTVEGLEFNGDIPEERFALPPELKKQQGQR
jgi:outer membrane lipoprotein-sorting protein